MTVTFDLTNEIAPIYRRSQLRLLTGDTSDGDGPRPNGGNFQDDELDVFLVLEADNMNRAAARIFEVLAAEWSRYAGSYRLGPESEEARQAEAFAARAAEWRSLYGFTVDNEGTAGATSAVVNWSDAYADWVGKF